jgi:dolichyl-phosphate-mannose-protein mannosyltransferase
MSARLTRARPELLILSAASALLHFWRLYAPNAVVWDELHFERHAGHYLAGTFYFDVHPPLGKLLYAAMAHVYGIPAAALLAGEPAPELRVLPALLGTLIVPLAYVLLRQLGAARRVAALGGFVVLCENALLVDTRLAFLEPFLISFGLLAVTLFLAAERRQSPARWILLAFSATMAGSAISVKWTGASALGVILTTWLFRAVFDRRSRSRAFCELAILVGIPVIIYVGAFAVHFDLLRRRGVDQAMMSPRFRTTLIDDPAYDPASHVSLFTKIVDVHGAMARGNRSLEYVTHAAASAWYTWPIMKHPILLWQTGATADPRSSLILLGNPVVWWGSGLVVLVVAVMLALRRIRLNEHRFAVAFLLGGFLLNYLPFIAIRRVMYLYHYLFALAWLILLAVMSLGVALQWNDPPDDVLWRFPTRRSAIAYWGTAAVVLVGFLYFSPFTFGWPISAWSYDARFWVLHPRV